MIFKETELKGAYLIELKKNEDGRGFFARFFCKKEFEQHGLISTIAQCSISHSNRKGTLRGMHYQIEPYEEAKVVTCLHGAIYDVIIDLRSGSPTYCKWIAAKLTATNRRMIYVPKGFAHGFQALEDNTDVFYLMSEFYHPESERGLRWNDHFFNIAWPVKNPVLSQKDVDIKDFAVSGEI